MKHLSRTLLVVMVLALALAAFTACDLIAPKECVHRGGEATCTEAPVCALCGEIYGAALGHVEETVLGKAANCTETGLTDGKKCSVCDAVIVKQEIIDALGHKDENKDHACDNGCDEYQGEHADATTDEDHLCDYGCGKAISEHDYDDGVVTTAPKCGEKGVKTFTCNCGHTYTEDVAALEHKDENRDHACDNGCTVYQGEHTDATTDKDHLCDYGCGEAASEHDYVGVETTAPNCTEKGVKTFTCNCGDSYTEDIPSNGHKDENNDLICDSCKVNLCINHSPADEIRESVVEATCKAAGSYVSVIKCSKCGEEMSRETKEIAQLSHTEEALDRVEATCETTGLTAGKKCSVCDEILEAQEVIPSLGHAYSVSYEWSDDNSTCKVTKVCANDASHNSSETATVSTVALNVTATKVTYTYGVVFADGEYTKTVEEDVTLTNSIATIYAPKIAGRVASHDYVKFGFHNAEATYTFDIYYSEVDVWDGTSVSESLSGEGTEESPYLIQSAADLAYIAKVVNDAAAGTTNFKGQYFKMTKSIDLNGKELKIGLYSASKAFHGYFDGNNCSIRGINATQSLFGMLKDGYIKNLSVYGKVITTENKGVAGLVSYMSGATVENITNYVNVTGVQQVAGVVGWLESNTTTFAKNCVNYGTVIGSSYQVGGIAGFAKGNISGCTNFGDVTSTASGYVGGIGGAAKDAKGTVTDCNNYGNVSGTDCVGGVIGFSNKSITNSNNYGDVVANCTSTSVAGIASGTPTLNNCNDYGSAEAKHNMTHHAAVKNDCEKDGNVEYWACSICKKNYGSANGGAEIADVVTPATGHDWDDGVVNGKEVTYTCKNGCGTTKVEAALTGFNYVWSEDNSSCTASAKYTVDGTTLSETAKVSIVTLNVTATKVTYTYKVEFAEGSFEAQTKTVDGDVTLENSIATIDAPKIAGRVASHDYVKFGFHNAEATYTFDIYYSEVDVWDGTSVSESLSGEGTEESPYLIQSAADLAYIAKVVNEAADSTANFKGIYFKMTKSINLGDKDFKIGLYSKKVFHGYFDGNNCSIRGLNNTQSLFGSLKDGYIKNLSVYGSVKSTTTKTGGLASYMTGATVENVTNYVTVVGTSAVGGIVGQLENNTTTFAKNCVNYGTVTANSYQIGGIAGNAKGNISGCTNFGDVTSTGSGYVGGIGGTANDAKGSRSDCVNYGNISGTDYIGGCFGTINKTTTDCYNYGTAKTLTTGKNIGEVVGGGASYLTYTEE